MPSKYIRETDDRIVLFPMTRTHKDVADAMGLCPKSAGFIIIDEGFAIANGGSSSLGIESLPDDKDVILAQLGACI